VTEIVVYVEGGGDRVALQVELRQGFDALFEKEKSLAKEKRGSLRFVCCGGREQAYSAFKNALKVNSDRINALLVDSESAIAPPDADEAKNGIARVAHLRQKAGVGVRGQGDGWELSDDLGTHVHLMVQCMESWIVSDHDALEGFYKQGFKKSTLPKRIDMEQEPKADLYDKLKRATKDTQKGEYGKIKHASKLLTMIDPEEIAKRCSRFTIFRAWLIDSIG
jgi:hypothetical protein